MKLRSITLPLLAGAALAAPAGALADVPGCAAPSAGGDWPVYGGSLDSHRDQSAEKAITTANVSSLALTWKLTMPDGGKIQSVPTEADGWWSHCVGYPGTADRPAFKSWIKTHQRHTNLFASAYHGGTVAGVRESLALRDQLVDFAADAQGLDAAALKERFLSTFAKAGR